MLMDMKVVNIENLFKSESFSTINTILSYSKTLTSVFHFNLEAHYSLFEKSLLFLDVDYVDR